MRIVLDADIFVSSMVNNRDNPYRIISAWQQGVFDVLMSSSMLEEIGRVLRYPRIVKRHNQDEMAIRRFLKLLENETILVEPTEVLNVIKEDESDNRYLECAIAGKASYVISGDNHLLAIGEYKGIAILRPAAFLAILGSGSMR